MLPAPRSGKSAFAPSSGRACTVDSTEPPDLHGADMGVRTHADLCHWRGAVGTGDLQPKPLARGCFGLSYDT